MGLLILFSFALVVLIGVSTVVLARRMTHPHRKSYAFAVAQKLPLDPAQLQLRSQEITLKYDDGTSAPAWVIEGEDGAGPLVVITHGWANCRYGALLKAALYVPYAWRVVVYDVRGHGDSTARTTTLGGREAEDLLALLDQVEHEGKGVVLVGSSMGAVATLLAAAQLSRGEASHRLVGVVVDGPYCSQLEPVVTHLRRDGLPAQPVAWLAHQLLRLTVRGYGQYDGVRAARELRCPLLVLHGTDDPICSIDSGRAVAQVAGRGRLIEFAGAGHGGLWSFDRERYAQALGAFMREAGDYAAEAR